MRFKFRNSWVILKKPVFKVIPYPTQWTLGTLNRTFDGYYILYIDYDYMKEEYILGELERLRLAYDLGDIHLFKSSHKGFHIISFVKLTAVEFMNILKESSCDEAFKNVPKFTSYRNWVLRHFSKGDTPKPKYLYTLESETKRESSYAHWNFIKNLYPEAKIKQPTNHDASENLTVIKYATGNNIG